MENKKLISEALLEIAQKSSTEFLDIGEDYDLIEAAEKLGITLPSPDLSVIKTVYAEIDKVNRNGVILPKEAVEKGLPTLIGKQINWEHQGAGHICGYIIDANINGNQIEITGVIFKSLFPEEMEEVKEKFDNKDLCVSFEIWNKNPETGESVVKELENGYRELNPITFHGCGLLLINQPACPKAKVYKLVAKVLTEAEKIIDQVFSEDLIFASMAIEESKCKNCNTCKCKEEVKIVEEIKVEEIIVEEKSTEVSQERLCPECKQPLKDEEQEVCAVCLKKKEKSSEETQAEVKPEETKIEEKSEIAETKSEEIKAEEIKEEVIVEVKEEATIITTTQETTKVDEIKPEGEVITTEVKIEEVVVNDEGKETQSIVEEVKTVITYTYEQVQEEVKVAQEELVAAMPKEVSDKIKELMKDGKSMKEAMKQAWDEYKKSQEKASEEKDSEIKNKVEELGKKDQEIADLKNPKPEDKKEKVLTVGNVEIKDRNKEVQKGIDDRAFGKR